MAKIDFGKMSRPPGRARPIDPIEVFRTLPKTTNAFNDLWAGQSDALREFHNNRKDADVLVSLNTGAGKTVVGLLIAQSLVNEDIGNVVYACATIDLVNQTAHEAERLGLTFTTRTGGDFSNDGYEAGKNFCITTYQAVLQPYSTFKGGKEPRAIIFDDAHVAEPIIRSQFTLNLSREEFGAFYTQLSGLVRQELEDYHAQQAFDDIVKGATFDTILLPFPLMWSKAAQVAGLLGELKLAKHKDLTYPWGYLRDRTKYCCFLMSQHGVEITPPFVPAHILTLFSRPDVRRVATFSPPDLIMSFLRSTTVM